MAEPSPSAVRGRPRLFSWCGLLLVLSLTLNLCALAGYFWSLSKDPEAHTPEHRVAAALSRIGIDPDSSPDFRSWQQEVHTAQAEMSRSCRPLFDEVWTEMAKPAPDQDRLRDLIDRITANRRAFETTLTAATIGYLHTLDEPERQALVQRLTSHPRN